MTCNTLYSDGTGISGHSPTPRRESIESLAKHIRLLVLDVDGVMTDGGLYYDANGLVMKRFHVLDGIGIRLAKTAGIEVAVLSGMDVPCSQNDHILYYFCGLGRQQMYYSGWDAQTDVPRVAGNRLPWR